MAPSHLSIATGALQRLVKEEASYHKEMEQQKVRIAKLEGEKGTEVSGSDGNEAFELRQEKQALEETKRVIPGLREKITSAREKLESLLGDDAANEQEKEKAMDVLKQAKEAQKDDPVG
ncbi:uncharacterized protein HMPREF1541_10564 [Cyphellophora europaea CBS 101466]|uniref:Tubulin-specific chaperone A n=1 Tax=Cyphellophora europaea (strain CBS 101466) TaxID=1220924 RepID=W2S914_CYPE1|nr:uncharacterized protein HMPREF1541_10564 [Cyphellophora europaea CBS 101466]ETN44384.1 hypothetical protein HMPREF1541_10564 [Cyphellophora europaea CBS 101466]